jgi:hypothetical protein
MNNKHWIDTRLTKEEMVFLNDAISDALRSSSSGVIKDKDNWFYETTLKKLTERMFYRDLDAYYKYHIEKEEPPPKFEMDRFWVNYMKQHEFNPLHFHIGLYSFVIFMKIPTHWKEQHEMNNDEFRTWVDSIPWHQQASDFVFVWGGEENRILKENFQLSPEDEGRILFFPAWLQHMVYPFYECEEERITISGNIILKIPNKPKVPEEVFELSGNVYEEKEKILKLLENTVETTKEELKQMKKEREKEGLN